MLLVMGVSIFTSRVILQTLGVEDYGIYNAVGGIVAVIGVLNGALSSSTSRFLAYELGMKNAEMLKRTFFGFIEFAYGCGFYCLAVG